MRATARPSRASSAALEADRQQAGAAASTARRCSSAMPAGAARNALDCAFWDLEAKRAGKPVHELAGLAAPQPLTTAYTISLGTPEAMAEAARHGSGAQAAQDQARRRRAIRSASRAVRAAAPHAELIVDANEGWTADNLAGKPRRLRRRRRHAGRAAAAGRRRRGARLDRAADPGLRRRKRARPRRPRRARRPLRRGQHQARQDRRPDRGAGDGGGGRAARLSASWSAAWSRPRSPWRRPCCSRSAPRVVDLDGPLLLAKDRPDGLRYEGSLVHPPTPALWG